MVMYFITGCYREVFKMVESCVSEELSPEELQIFSQLEFLGNDYHPDAHACRLKLSVVTIGLGEGMRCPWSLSEETSEYVRKHGQVSSACRLTPNEELIVLNLCSTSFKGKLPIDLLNRKAFVAGIVSAASGGGLQNRKMTVKLGSEAMPNVIDFDGEPDISILSNPKNTMAASKLFGTAYTRPDDEQIQFGSLAALQFMNNALNSGIEVTSGQYGFPLLYDLLVGTVPFKLHPSDKSHNWGRLLVRLLPPSDFNTPSAEMSALKILAENPTVAAHPSIPRFQIDSTMGKFKGILQGKDAVSRVLEQLNLFLTKPIIRSMISHPPMYKVSASITQNVITLNPSTTLEHRLWIVPRISDFSQDMFHLDIQNCASVNIPLLQLQSFAAKPLSPIKLESFVVFLDRNQRRLPLVSSAVPFDLAGEKVATTHCSEATMQRIRTDVRKYAESANSESQPTLLGFTPSDIDSFHNSPTVYNKALAQVNALMKSLEMSMFYDRKSLSNLMFRALAIATSDERSDVPMGGGDVGECNFLRFRLGQCSEREPSAWFELLVASILSTSAERDIRSLNPFLSATAYKTVTSLTVVAMLTSIRISQTHRALTG